MRQFAEDDIEALLDAWPRLRRRPGSRPGICTLAGPFAFRWAPPGMPEISDTYALRIEILLDTCGALLGVFEEGGRLRRDPDEHVNEDGNLCLGSPLRLQMLLRDSDGLVAFVESCVVPFLYAASWRSQGNAGYPFHELSHNGLGLIEDYGVLLRIQGHQPIAIALSLLAMKRRVANKRQCPCTNGKRLGACPCHHRLNALRSLAPRRFWRGTLVHYLHMNPLPETQPRRKRARKHSKSSRPRKDRGIAAKNRRWA